MITIDLTGKLAVITGASGQLGRVMAATLAKAGADIAVHYHKNREQAEKLVCELRKIGIKAESFTADIGDLSEVLTMRDAIFSRMGRPDIVVDAAVIQYQPWKPVLEQSIEDYEGQFRSCVLHNVNMAKAFLPAMKEKGWGRFIGINTECAMQCYPTQSAYAAAKRGMDGVMRVLAKEVGGFGITVNQVAPGWTISERWRKDPGDDRAYASKVPLKRRGTDQEIANAVLFLASDLADYITGVYLPVCGGNVMPCI